MLPIFLSPTFSSITIFLLMTSSSYAIFPHWFWIVMRVLGRVCDAPLHTEMWSCGKHFVACIYVFSLLCIHVCKWLCVTLMCSYLCLSHNLLRRKLISKCYSSVTWKQIKKDIGVMEWDAHADRHSSGTTEGPASCTVLLKQRLEN